MKPLFGWKSVDSFSAHGLERERPEVGTRAA